MTARLMMMMMMIVAIGICIALHGMTCVAWRIIPPLLFLGMLNDKSIIDAFNSFFCMSVCFLSGLRRAGGVMIA